VDSARKFGPQKFVSLPWGVNVHPVQPLATPMLTQPEQVVMYANSLSHKQFLTDYPNRSFINNAKFVKI